MPKESDQARRRRKAKEARSRRRKRGLISCAGRGQGRKMQDLPDRPTCCDRLMLSNGLKWHCKACGASPKKKRRKMMTKGEFASLLGLHSNSEEDISIEGAIAIMRSALSALMPSQQGTDSDIRGTTVLEWDGCSMLLQDSEGKLYRIGSISDEGLLISQDCGLAFDLLFDEDALGKVFDIDAVAELQRLHAEYVAENTTKKRDARRANYELLKAEFEGVSDD